jgi:hypothetical protein
MTARSKKNPTAFMVAGNHSGFGKTTVTLTLLRAVLAYGSSVELDGRITVSSNQPKGAAIQLDVPLDLPS